MESLERNSDMVATVSVSATFSLRGLVSSLWVTARM